MLWKTSISGNKDGEMYIRGEKLLDLIGKISFTEAIYFILKGNKPNDGQRELLDTILVMAISHGIEAPSSYVPRVVTSTGNSVTSALASGVLSIGDYHGGAVEGAMRMLSSNESAKNIVAEFISSGKRVPGYGHKVYKDKDPRTEAMDKKLQELKIDSKYWKLAVEISKELESDASKKLPLNIDGAMAVGLLELGFDPIQGKAFFALARFPSMMANIEEELKNEKPYRRLSEEDVDYTQEK